MESKESFNSLLTSSLNIFIDGSGFKMKPCKYLQIYHAEDQN